MAITKPERIWKYEDLFNLPDDKRYEIIDGELYEMTAPRPKHQRAIGKLFLTLVPPASAIGAEVMLSPLDVFMPGADPAEPDLLVLLPEKLHLVSDRGVEGAPDLVVEVLSPSNPNHDLKRKRELYARGGVSEYWIVDPDAAKIEVLVLSGTQYRTDVSAGSDELVTSTILPGLSFQSSTIFG